MGCDIRVWVEGLWVNSDGIRLADMNGNAIHHISIDFWVMSYKTWGQVKFEKVFMSQTCKSFLLCSMTNGNKQTKKFDRKIK